MRWIFFNFRADVYADFVAGHFVTQKTKYEFSSMAHDQIHEQQNAIVKGDGGVIGITEKEDALQRWMVEGPEICLILGEYQSKHSPRCVDYDRHHEQIPSTQKLFALNMKSVIEVIEEMGNPFSDHSSDLVTLHANVIMSGAVVNTTQNIEEIGTTQHHCS